MRGVPFGTQYPNDLRDILVENGTLNADYTPNERTAQRMGWELKEPEDVPVAGRYWLSDTERTKLIEQERSKSRTATIQDASGKELPSVVGFWFAWYAFHKDTRVYTAPEN